MESEAFCMSSADAKDGLSLLLPTSFTITLRKPSQGANITPENYVELDHKEHRKSVFSTIQ